MSDTKENKVIFLNHATRVRAETRKLTRELNEQADDLNIFRENIPLKPDFWYIAL